MNVPEGHEIVVVPDPAALVHEAAERLASELSAMTWGPRFVLSGGKTPLPVYVRLSAAGSVDWSRVRFTFGDERCVAPDHADSNYASVKSALFDPLGVAGDRVVRIRGEDPPERAAEKAHRELLDWAARVPLFDLVLLGIGADGHVASLFPADAWPAFGNRLAVAASHPGGGDRVTLTPAALRSTRLTCYLVSGEGKAAAVRTAFAAPEPTPRVPSRMVAGEGRNLWFLDRAAASLLPESVAGAVS
jgi:6-phosphogluconolactonase